MTSGSIALTLASPLLLHGAAPKGSAEIRPAPVRGLLRYWLRAALRGSGASTDDVREVEDRIFGSTAGDGGASQFRFELRSKPGGKEPSGGSQDWFLLPHSTDERKRKGTTSKGYGCGGELELRWLARPGGRPQDRSLVEALLPVAVALGGIGGRSRRGFGSLVMPGDRRKVVDLIQALQQEVHAQKLSGKGSQGLDVPRLAPETCSVLEMKRRPDQSPAKQQFENLLKDVMAICHDVHKGRGAGPTFGKASGGRRASALHVRILAQPGSEGPSLRVTVFKAEDAGQPPVREGMMRFEKGLDLVKVWGEPWWH